MDLRLIEVPTDICDYPAQPRSQPDWEYCRNLGGNMKAAGQKTPVIGWFAEGRFLLADGGCRLEAAKLADIPDLLAIDLGKEPTPAELLMAQASIDVQKQFLPPVDRARLYKANIETRNCTGKFLANELGKSESFISRHLQLLNLAPDLQEKVNTGELKWSKGAVIAQETSDPEAQRRLAVEAGQSSRDVLVAKIRQKRNGDKPEAGRSKIRLALVSGVTATFRAKGLTIGGAIKAAAEAKRVLEKGRKEGLTAATIQRMRAETEAHRQKQESQDDGLNDETTELTSPETDEKEGC